MKVINCMLDWLEFSIFDDDFVGQKYNLEKIVKMFEFEDLTFEHSRSFYYENMYNYQNMIYIYTGPKGANSKVKHVHIKFTGKGCRFLEQKYNNYDLRNEIYARCGMASLKVSRMDIAVDYDKKFLQQFISPAMNYRFTGYKTRKIIMENSNTIYLGSKKSEKFIRIYEKDKESNNSKYSDRIELVLKNEYATSELFNFSPLVKIVSAYMSQVQWDDEDINKLWNELQSEKCEISKGIRHVKTTLKEKVDYILETYGKTLKAGVEAFGAKNVLKCIHESLLSEKLLREIKFVEKLRVYKLRKKHNKEIYEILESMYFRNKFEQVGIC